MSSLGDTLTVSYSLTAAERRAVRKAVPRLLLWGELHPWELVLAYVPSLLVLAWLQPWLAFSCAICVVVLLPLVWRSSHDDASTGPRRSVARLSHRCLEIELGGDWIRYGPGAFEQVRVAPPLVLLTGPTAALAIPIRDLAPACGVQEFVDRACSALLRPEGPEGPEGPEESDESDELDESEELVAPELRDAAGGERRAEPSGARPAWARDDPLGGDEALRIEFQWGTEDALASQVETLRTYPQGAPAVTPRASSIRGVLTIVVLAGAMLGVMVSAAAHGERFSLLTGALGIGVLLLLPVLLLAQVQKRRWLQSSGLLDFRLPSRVRFGAAGWERWSPAMQSFHGWGNVESLRVSRSVIVLQGPASSRRNILLAIPRRIFESDGRAAEFLGAVWRLRMEWLESTLTPAAGSPAPRLDSDNPYQSPSG